MVYSDGVVTVTYNVCGIVMRQPPIKLCLLSPPDVLGNYGDIFNLIWTVLLFYYSLSKPKA